MNKLILLSLLTASLTTAALADRPYVSEKPSTVSPGVVQLEAGATYTRGGSDKSVSGEAVLSTGLSKSSDIQIGTSYGVLHTGSPNRQSGITDGSVAVKLRLTPHSAVQVGTSLPFGSNNFTSNSYDPFAKLILGTNLSKNLYAFANVGYQYNRTDGADGSLFGSLALEQTLDEKSKAFVEVYGLTNNRFNDSGGSVAVGLIHKVNDRFQFDVRAGRNLNKVGEPNFFGGVGITVSN
jgi:hypothetical protein